MSNELACQRMLVQAVALMKHVETASSCLSNVPYFVLYKQRPLLVSQFAEAFQLNQWVYVT